MKIIFYILLLIGLLGVVDVLTADQGSSLIREYYGTDIGEAGYVTAIIFDLVNSTGSNIILNFGMMVAGLLHQAWALSFFLAFLLAYKYPEVRSKPIFKLKTFIKVGITIAIVSALFVALNYINEPVVTPLESKRSDLCNDIATRLTAVGRDIEGFTPAPEEIRLKIHHFPPFSTELSSQDEYDYWVEKCTNDELEDGLI